MNEPRRIALLIELPIGLENAGLPALRRFLKVLVRTYGIRCLSVLPPNETRTFANYVGSTVRNDEDGTLADSRFQCSKYTANAKPEGLAKPKKRKQTNFFRGMKPL